MVDLTDSIFRELHPFIQFQLRYIYFHFPDLTQYTTYIFEMQKLQK